MAVKTFWKLKYSFLISTVTLHGYCAPFQLKFDRRCKTSIDTRHIDICTQLQLKQNEVADSKDITIPIIYEDDNILAISKPPHVSHHDDPPTGQMGILSLIRAQQAEQIFPYTGRLYGVHRLDHVTSGILLFAKDSTTAGELIRKFQKREVTKYYFAISGKKPKKKKQGWVKGQMVMGRRGSYKLLNQKEHTNLQIVEEGNNEKNRDERGGYAVTRFYTAGLGSLDLALSTNQQNEDDGQCCAVPKTAILFEPHTGKTHQLRVAGKSVGLPILGDVRYGGGRIITEPYRERELDHDMNYSEAEQSKFDRTYLHATAIDFQMRKGYNVTIYSRPPFGFLFEKENALDEVFITMVDKYCDSVHILDAIHAASNT